jgi:3-carboxy-cis,cis-muconate cycloisomerase
MSKDVGGEVASVPSKSAMTGQPGGVGAGSAANERRPFLPLSAVFGDPVMAGIFSEIGYVEAWLAVERGLASVQADLGLVPAHAAARIAEALRVERIDLARLREETRTVGYPILPLLTMLSESTPADVGAYLHLGATTQDIMDTGLILQVERALDRIDELASRLGDAIAGLAVAHRSTIMAARTHAQQAVPTTLGAKAAVWLAEVGRHRQRLAVLRPRLLVVELFGAGGTAAALGPHSRAVRHGLATRLGLGSTDVPWHTSRDNLAELGFVLAAMASTCVKLARELIELSRSEIAEVREASGRHRGASSTMPQKANPILSEAIVGMGSLAIQQVPALLAAMQAGHERAAGEWQIEWDTIPTLFSMAAGCLSTGAELVLGLQVFPARMLSNLDADGGMVMAEALMMAAAGSLGRARAHAVVYDLCVAAREQGRPLRDVVRELAAPELLANLPAIDDLLAPASYLGEAEVIVDEALAAWEQQGRDR